MGSPSGPPLSHGCGRHRDLLVPVHRVSTHAWGLRPRGAVRNLAFAIPSMWPSPSPDRVGAPDRVFRGSIPSLHVPLSTLHAAPYDTSRMTRGQSGSLFLLCVSPSFTTRRRFSPAHQAKTPTLLRTLVGAVDFLLHRQFNTCRSQREGDQFAYQSNSQY